MGDAGSASSWSYHHDDLRSRYHGYLGIFEEKLSDILDGMHPKRISRSRGKIVFQLSTSKGVVNLHGKGPNHSSFSQCGMMSLRFRLVFAVILWCEPPKG